MAVLCVTSTLLMRWVSCTFVVHTESAGLLCVFCMSAGKLPLCLWLCLWKSSINNLLLNMPASSTRCQDFILRTSASFSALWMLHYKKRKKENPKTKIVECVGCTKGVVCESRRWCCCKTANKGYLENMDKISLCQRRLCWSFFTLQCFGTN